MLDACLARPGDRPTVNCGGGAMLGQSYAPSLSAIPAEKQHSAVQYLKPAPMLADR